MQFKQQESLLVNTYVDLRMNNESFDFKRKHTMKDNTFSNCQIADKLMKENLSLVQMRLLVDMKFIL